VPQDQDRGGKKGSQAHQRGIARKARGHTDRKSKRVRIWCPLALVYGTVLALFYSHNACASAAI
jgi:hypothetical protein